jgi:hypothetical protein
MLSNFPRAMSLFIRLDWNFTHLTHAPNSPEGEDEKHVETVCFFLMNRLFV